MFCCMALNDLVTVAFIFNLLNGGQTGYTTCTQKQYDEDFPCNYIRKKGYHDFKDIGKCLRFVHRKTTWDSAQTECEKDGGWLVKMRDRNEIPSANQLSGDYWIGLNDVRNESDYRWHLNDDSPPASDQLPQNSALNKSLSQWARGQPDDHEHEQNCVVTNANARWRDERCDRTFPYICEVTSGRKPLPPLLEIKYHRQPDTLISGQDVVAYCSGFSAGGYEWVTSDENYADQSLVHLDTSKQVLTHRLDKGRCGVFTNFTLTVRVLPSLDGGDIRCCSTPPNLHAYTRSCTGTPRISVLVDSQKPWMAMTFHKLPSKAYTRRPIQGKCRAAVGTRGFLFINIEGTDIQGSYIATTKGRLYTAKPLDKVRVRVYPEQQDRLKGPIVTAVFRICATGSLQGAVVTCSTESLISEKLQLTSSAKMVILPAPLSPTLKVNYHQLPNLVNIGETLRATCHAFVGLNGELVWKLSRGEQRSVWRIAVNKPFRLRYSDEWKGLHIRCTKGTDLENGPHVNSTLEIPVQRSLHGIVLSCHSFDPDSRKWDAAIFNGRQLFKWSRPLNVTHLPRKPAMSKTVIRDEEQRTWFANVTCFGHVGVGGSLSWVLLTGTWARTWSIHLSGNVSQTKLLKRDSPRLEKRRPAALNYALTFKPAAYDAIFGPTLTSSLTIEISPAVEGAVLACYSRDVTRCRAFRSAKHDLGVSVVLKKEGDDFDILRRSSPRTLAIAVAILMMILLFLALTFEALQEKRGTGGAEDEKDLDLLLDSLGPSWSSRLLRSFSADLDPYLDQRQTESSK